MQKRSKKKECKESTRIAPFFAFFFSGSTALGIHGADSNALKMAF
jgi:hypothetical protein